MDNLQKTDKSKKYVTFNLFPLPIEHPETAKE